MSHCFHPEGGSIGAWIFDWEISEEIEWRERSRLKREFGLTALSGRGIPMCLDCSGDNSSMLSPHH